MYICDGCGNLFDDPISYDENYGERFSLSPCCLESYSEAEECQVCGHYAKKLEMQEGLCSDCQGDTEREFRMLLLSQFTDAQRAYLSVVYEGDCF